LNFTALAPVKLVPVIVTDDPTAPLVGVNEVTVGAAGVTVKLDALVPVPAAVVTLIVPVVAAAGTVVVIDVDETTVKVAVVPLNFTAVAPVKLRPVSVTDAPTVPEEGANEVTFGATVKFELLDPVPLGVVTEILPVVAPAGTVVVIEVDETTVNGVAAVVLNFTAVAPVKFLPVIETEMPTAPLVGLNDVTDGAVVSTLSGETIPSDMRTSSGIGRAIRRGADVAARCASTGRRTPATPEETMPPMSRAADTSAATAAAAARRPAGSPLIKPLSPRRAAAARPWTSSNNGL
jgi:hypothetical protein